MKSAIGIISWLWSYLKEALLTLSPISKLYKTPLKKAQSLPSIDKRSKAALASFGDLNDFWTPFTLKDRIAG